MPHIFSRAALAASLGATLAASAFLPTVADARSHGGRALRPGSVPTFSISTFAQGNANLYNPDGIVVTSSNVFVDYQNNSDHVNGVPSIIVKYDRSGNVLGEVKLYGRCDGLRLNPYTNQLWALLNNDGLNGNPPRQPKLYTIDPSTLQATLYTFPPRQPHGGGYDDLAFSGGHAFLSASSPTLNHGFNDKPVLVEAALRGTKVAIRPVLYGNAYGYDIEKKAFEKLNITDPDSLFVSPAGDVVLTSEADSQLIYIKNPGTANQSVSRLGLGTNLDDSAYTTGTSGTLFVADDVADVVYSIAATYPAGTLFSIAPAGAPVQGFVATLDPTTGLLSPLLTALNGISSPAAMVFVPSGQ